MGKENPKKSLEEKIWDNLIEHGFDTEIKTLQILKKEGFSVVTQYPFIDSTDNGIRSIDLQCSMYEYNDDKPSIFEILKKLTIFIECKKSKKEKWVFYTEPKKFYYEKFSRDFHLYDVALRKRSMLWKISRPKEAETIFPQRLGLVQTTAFGTTNMFHTAEMQILKAVSFYMKNNYPLGNFDPKFELIIPVIVFEGQIFEYQISQKSDLFSALRKLLEPEIEVEEEISKEMPIKKAQYIPFMSNGIPEDPSPVLIDIVTLDYLPNYLNLINDEFNKLPGKTNK